MACIVFFDRQTNVPTVSALVSSVPGLQDLLDRLGISATTPQQIASLLQNDAMLQALGLVSNLTLNLSPVLTQAGGTLSWSKRASTQQLFLSYLYSSNQMTTSTQQSMVYSATYSRKLTPSNTIFASSRCTPVVAGRGVRLPAAVRDFAATPLQFRAVVPAAGSKGHNLGDRIPGSAPGRSV